MCLARIHTSWSAMAKHIFSLKDTVVINLQIFRRGFGILTHYLVPAVDILQTSRLRGIEFPAIWYLFRPVGLKLVRLEAPPLFDSRHTSFDLRHPSIIFVNWPFQTQIYYSAYLLAEGLGSEGRALASQAQVWNCTYLFTPYSIPQKVLRHPRCPNTLVENHQLSCLVPLTS